MTSKVTPLPCPFCGDEAVELEDGRLFCGLGVCGAFHQRFATPEQWNRRPEQQGRLVAALRELLNFGIESDDSRLDYIVAHVDRDAVGDARGALAEWEASKIE